jgi:hypothetical protein
MSTSGSSETNVLVRIAEIYLNSRGCCSMIRTSSGRNAVLGGLAGLFLSGLPSVAAPGPGEAASRAGQQQKFCLNSAGPVHHLVTIDNGLDGSFQCLGLSAEHGVVVALRLETHHVATSGRQADVRTEEFPLAIVESSRGAVLDGVPGHDAIILRGHFPRSPAKVELMTTFLYNGFTNEYRSCPISLDRQPNGSWYLLNRFNQVVSRISVRTRQMPVIGAFGIADLEGVCTPRER